MADVTASAHRSMPAPPPLVYRCIADYRRHHHHWLPPDFSDYHVEVGGDGAGTVYAYRLKAGSRARDYRMRVTETSPNAVLMERDANSSLVTTWTIALEASGSRVSVETRWRGAGGVRGFFERIFAPRALSRLYDTMLERLDNYARQLEP